MKKVIYSKELLEEKIKNCFSFAELCKRLGLMPEGSNPKTVRKKLDQYGIDYSHFNGKGWNKPEHPCYGNRGLPIDQFFVKNSSAPTSKVKKRLLKNSLKEDKCEECGIINWRNKPITIQLHHINGDNTDNRLENLQMLCPNCHTQTDSFCKRHSVRNTN